MCFVVIELRYCTASKPQPCHMQSGSLARYLVLLLVLARVRCITYVHFNFNFNNLFNNLKSYSVTRDGSRCEREIRKA